MRTIIKTITISCLALGVTTAALADDSSVALSQFEQNVAQAVHGSKGSTTQAVPHEQNLEAKALNSQPSVGQLMNQRPSAPQQAAYGQMLNQAMPMTPTQIINMKRRIAAAQRASSAPVSQPPQPVTSSRILNLAPGATPPVIRLQKGFISTLDFVDSSGNAWPIQAFDNGNPEAFNVSWNKKGNSFMIQARKAYTYGNIAVDLKGLPTPIMLTLIPAQHKVDYRVDLRVPGAAPGTSGSLGGENRLPKSATQQLLNVLNGIAPQGGKAMRVIGGDAQAWTLKNDLFLRTRFPVLSPGWVGHMKSPDGTYAYVLPKTPTVLVSEYGTPVQFKITRV